MPVFSIVHKDWIFTIQHVNHVSGVAADVFLPMPLRPGTCIRLHYHDQDFRMELQGLVHDLPQLELGGTWRTRISWVSNDQDKKILYFMALRKYLDAFDGNPPRDASIDSIPCIPGIKKIPV